MRRNIANGFVLLACLLLSAASRGAALTDYIDDKVIFAGETDARKLDLETIEKWLVETMKAAEMYPAAEQPEVEKDLHKNMSQAKQWMADYQKAGGSSLYMLVNGSGFGNSDPMLIVAPLEAGANSNAVMSLFINGTPNGPTTRPAPKGQQAQFDRYMPRPELVSGQGVLFGTPPMLTWAKAMKSKDRPEVSTALAAGEGGTVHAVMAPTDSFRQFLKQHVPPNVLGQSTAPLTQGIVWISARAAARPGPTGHLVIQAKDAITATKINQLITSALAMWKLMNQGAAIANAEDVMLLIPTVSNDQLVLDLDNDKAVKIARQLGPVMRKQRHQAVEMASMSNMRQLLLGCVMYSNDHKGDWPDKLDAIGKYLGGDEMLKRILSNPVHPERKPAYIYVKPQHIRQASQQMVIYESHTKFDGVNAGFADGHVERVMDKQRFADLLQAAQDASGDKDSGL
jgi:prepilin-type processing-associated H-X9-DG protein